MAFTELLSSLGATSGKFFHLEQDSHKTWKVVQVPSEQDSRQKLQQFAEEFESKVASCPMSLEELDFLEEGLKSLSIATPNSGIFSIFSRAVTAQESDEFKRFVRAKEKLLDTATFANFAQTLNSLDYLVAKDDLCRFARLFRALFDLSKKSPLSQSSMPKRVNIHIDTTTANSEL